MILGANFGPKMYRPDPKNKALNAKSCKVGKRAVKQRPTGVQTGKKICQLDVARDHCCRDRTCKIVHPCKLLSDSQTFITWVYSPVENRPNYGVNK